MSPQLVGMAGEGEQGRVFAAAIDGQELMPGATAEADGEEAVGWHLYLSQSSHKGLRVGGHLGIVNVCKAQQRSSAPELPATAVKIRFPAWR